MATAEFTRSALLSHLVKSAKSFSALKDLRFCLPVVSKLEVEVPARDQRVLFLVTVQ